MSRVSCQPGAPQGPDQFIPGMSRSQRLATICLVTLIHSKLHFEVHLAGQPLNCFAENMSYVPTVTPEQRRPLHLSNPIGSEW